MNYHKKLKPLLLSEAIVLDEKTIKKALDDSKN
ncbi:Uncharacterised protein [Streptococcus agalactiae]|nr:Uncharacterised protein [Streptococcus agalactiae]